MLTIFATAAWLCCRVVKGLKLSKEELGQELLPEVCLLNSMLAAQDSSWWEATVQYRTAQ